MIPAPIPLRIEEPAGVVRTEWPASCGVPFPPGRLADSGGCRIEDPAGRPVRLQTECLGRWPDGSIQGLRLDFPVELPGAATAEYRLRFDGAADVTTPLRVEETEEGFAVDTGPIRFRVSKRRFAFVQDLFLGGHRLLGPAGCRLTVETAAGGRFDVHGAGATVELTARGPQRASIRAVGRHRAADGGDWLSYEVRLTAWAGRPWIEIGYTFIHTGGDTEPADDGTRVPFTRVRRIRFEAPVALGDRPRFLARGERHALDMISTVWSGQPLEVNQERGRFDVREGGGRVAASGTNAYGWMAAEDGEAGLTLVPHDFARLHPKRATAGPEGLAYDLVPEAGGPLKLHRGVAKRHAWTLVAHAPVGPRPEGFRVPAEFHMNTFHYGRMAERFPALTQWRNMAAGLAAPLVPHAPDAVYRESTLFDDLPAYRPTRYPMLEQTLREYFASRTGAAVSGMLDAGDSGRPGRWDNNQYDFPHAAFLQFVRTGERPYWTAGVESALHGMDVDFCHDSDDPMERGTLHRLGAGHVAGYPQPMMPFVEGFLDYYYLSGEPDALRTAVSIGDYYLRCMAQPEPLSMMPNTARTVGWGLTALAALSRATGLPRFTEGADRLFRQMREWHAAWPGLAYNTEDNRLYWGVSGFFAGVACQGLRRYWQLTRREEVRVFYIELVRYLMDHARLPEGFFFYKQPPEIRRAVYYMLEGVGYAYELSGETDFLDQGMMTFVWLETRLFGLGASHVEVAHVFRHLLPFLRIADDSGRLARYYDRQREGLW